MFGVAKRMLGEHIFTYHAASHQVLGDDALEYRRIAAATTPVRIDDGNRTALADAQAVRLGPQDAALLERPSL